MKVNTHCLPGDQQLHFYQQHMVNAATNYETKLTYQKCLKYYSHGLNTKRDLSREREVFWPKTTFQQLQEDIFILEDNPYCAGQKVSQKKVVFFTCA